MYVDMLAHFDEWQRTGQDDLYEAQDQWPFELRRARVITAVDYIQVLPIFIFVLWVGFEMVLSGLFISLINRFRRRELVGS